jgi:uncharacterized membrane protein
MRRQATLFLVDPICERIEALRRRWDPEMAARLAAHVTLVYTQEFGIPSLVTERLREASQHTAPFRLRLGQAATFAAPLDGVYIAVEDVDGGVARLRRRILQPPLLRTGTH